MRLRLLGLAALALAAAAPGCGDDDDPPAEPIDGLARYLPAGSPGVLSFADFAAAREQLGLPPDADTLSFELLFADDYDPDSPESRLNDAANAAMSGLGVKSESCTFEVRGALDDESLFPEGEGCDRLEDIELEPVTEAFDGRAIAAALTGGGSDGTLTAIQTSQPFEELATALASEGYEREGDVLSKPGAEVNEVAAAGDGIVVLSTDGASAADAIADPGGGPAAALNLVEPADEPIVQVLAGFEESCVTGYGGWQEGSGASGAFVIATDGPADVERVELDGFEKFTETDVGEPSADGSMVQVPFGDGGEDGRSPLRDLIAGSLGQGLYGCG